MSKFNFTGDDAEKRGDTTRLLFTITRAGAPLNLAGCTFKFRGKQWLTDTTWLIDKDNSAFTVLDENGGEVYVTIDPEDTLGFTDTIILNCECEMTEPDGRVTTVADGKLEYKMDVA